MLPESARVIPGGVSIHIKMAFGGFQDFIESRNKENYAEGNDGAVFIIQGKLGEWRLS